MTSNNAILMLDAVDKELDTMRRDAAGSGRQSGLRDERQQKMRDEIRKCEGALEVAKRGQ